MFNKVRFLAAALGLLALAACGKAPEKVTPALWQVDGPKGERAWLMGTIHALPAPVDWHSAPIDQALAASDGLILEVAAVDDDARTARIFASLAQSPGLPPLDQRIAPDLRDDLAKDLKANGLDAAKLSGTETWAAALMLAQALQGAVEADSANGIDRALVKAAKDKPVSEFEGAERQLRLFDALPEAQQQALLAAVVKGADQARDESRRIETAWKKGDMAAIAATDHTGMLADPALRQVLLVGRNQAWSEQLILLLGRGRKPFVAVGAAHLAGSDGLPALLEARGYKVRRIQ